MYVHHDKVTFDNLSHEAQLARLSDLAKRAVDFYGLKDAHLHLTTYTNNAVYRVEASSGMFTLRIHRPGLKSLAWLRSEQIWLRALTENRLYVPSPAGDIYIGELEDEPLPAYCTLTTWLKGEHIALADMTDDHIRMIGQLIGQLHTVASAFVPPADFVRPTLDYEGLFGENSPYNPKDGAKIFTDDQLSVMADVQARVLEVFEQLGKTSHTFGLIHADLIPKNLLWDEGQVGAIDFDDSGYGYYLYDLAPFLWMNRNEPNYAQLRLMLWDGYQQARPQPEAYIDYLQTLVMARHIASCRWIAGNLSNPSVRDRAPQVIAERVAEMKTFLMQPNNQ
ncbi:MAG: hypothetical protein CUN52_06290 [Phototrophicales bacterium]|nr:MAG: hypothetical protein CUN52_06290 [Phototrophicales bacterium]